MMAVAPIGLDYNNITDFNLTIDLPSRSADWIPAIIQNANASTGHLFTFIIMSAWFIIVFWTLSDKSPFGEFKYSDPRGFNLALGCVTTLGISFLEAGFFTSFRIVALFLVLFMLSYIMVITYENKE